MPGKVTINSATFIENYGWHVACTVEYMGTRSGSEYVNLPASATEDELCAAILAAYGAR